MILQRMIHLSNTWVIQTSRDISRLYLIYKCPYPVLLLTKLLPLYKIDFNFDVKIYILISSYNGLEPRH